jgi:hypothetical protein
MKVTTPFHVPVAGLLRDLGTSSSVSFVAPFDEAHEFEPRAYGDRRRPAERRRHGHGPTRVLSRRTARAWSRRGAMAGDLSAVLNAD